MGEGNIFYKRKDHQEEDSPGDRGPHPGPKGANKPPQGYRHDIRHILCQHNTIIHEP